MNVYQEIFLIFFAIIWGTTVSVQGRWNLFPFALITHIFPQALLRLILSIFLFNIIPIFYVAYTLRNLASIDFDYKWENYSDVFVVLCYSIVPAIAVFGFYRLWVAIVEFFPRCFYRNEKDRGIPVKMEPTLKSLKLRALNTSYSEKLDMWAVLNLIVGLAYLVIALFASRISWETLI